MVHLSECRVRSATLAMSLWLFGIFTTLVLVGVWGRAVTSDRVTLTDSTELLLASDLVSDRFEAWLTDGVAASLSVAPAELAPAVAMVTDSPEMDAAVRLAADEAVTSALSPPGTAPTVDLHPAAVALVPAVSRALATAGIDVAPEVVQSMMGDTDLELSAAPGSWASGAALRATAALTSVLVLGLVGMTATGGLAVWSSEDRVSRVRSLAWRLALSSITFALMLRLGSWAVDPTGGRSPAAGAASVLLGSNGHTPLLMGAGATGVALAARWRWRHHTAGVERVQAVRPSATRT